MLPRSQRFLLRRYPAFFQSARRAHTAHFMWFTQPQDSWQAAVIVPKKVAKLAVTRHRVKRQTHQALSDIYAQFKSSLIPAAVVLVAKAGADKLHPSDLKAELTQGLTHDRSRQNSH